MIWSSLQSHELHDAQTSYWPLILTSIHMGKTFRFISVMERIVQFCVWDHYFLDTLCMSRVSVCLCCGPLALSQTDLGVFWSGLHATQFSRVCVCVCVCLHSLLTHWHSRQPLGSCWKPNGQSCPEREQFSNGGQSSGLTVSYDGSRRES